MDAASKIRPVLAAILLLPAAALLADAKESELFNRAQKVMGGADQMSAVRTISYEFEEKRGAMASFVQQKGRHYFEFENGQCTAGVLQTNSSKGKSRIVFDGETMHYWKNGVLMSDPDAINKAWEDVAQYAFWMFVPLNLEGAQAIEGEAPVAMDGGFCWPLDIRLSEVPVFFENDHLTLYLDTRNGLLKAAKYTPAGKDAPVTISFKDYDVGHPLVLAMTRKSESREKSSGSSFALSRLRINASRQDAQVALAFEDPFQWAKTAVLVESNEAFRTAQASHASGSKPEAVFFETVVQETPAELTGEPAGFSASSRP